MPRGSARSRCPPPLGQAATTLANTGGAMLVQSDGADPGLLRLPADNQPPFTSTAQGLYLQVTMASHEGGQRGWAARHHHVSWGMSEPGVTLPLCSASGVPDLDPPWTLKVNVLSGGEPIALHSSTCITENVSHTFCQSQPRVSHGAHCSAGPCSDNSCFLTLIATWLRILGQRWGDVPRPNGL